MGKPKKETIFGDTYYEVYIGYPVLMAVLGVFWGILMILQFMCFEYIIYGFFNPEYWALKEILNSLRPHVH